jgi:RNA polymerase sigma-54 factor
MNWLAPKLNLRVAQKQILTPGLVQMVSVLALNRLELREMINQEIMANPVLEELGDDGVVSENYTDENFVKNETEKVPEGAGANPFDEFDFGSFFGRYLDTGTGTKGGEHEDLERPSFEKFLSSGSSLSDHLKWQISVAICSETVREIAEDIVGNLDENGYLAATVAEIAAASNYSSEDMEEALTMVQEFDPPGVGARDLAECLLRKTPWPSR